MGATHTSRDSQRSQSTLGAILNPTSVEVFFHEYWEARHLHASGRAATLYEKILTPADIDQYLTRDDLRYPSLRMMRAGRPVPLEDFTRPIRFGEYRSDGLVDVDRVYEAYGSGASIILQLMRSSLSGVSRFANDLQQDLGFNVEATVYVTPPGEQGFTTHYDTHSVFVLQIAGKKRWRLYDWAADRPLLSQTFDATRYAVTPAAHEMTLSPGDLLYVPRGLAHDASATEDEPSIHVTIGLFPMMWRDLVEKQIEHLKAEAQFRRAPISYFARDKNSLFAEEFGCVVREGLGGARLDDLVADLRGEHIARQSRMTAGRMRDSSLIPSLNLASRVQLREGIVFDCTRRGTRQVVRFYDREIAVPIKVSDAVERLLSGAVWTVRDLQENLAEDGRLSIARRFAVEGLVRIVD